MKKPRLSSLQDSILLTSLISTSLKVVFFLDAECAPVMVILEYVSDSERDTGGKKAEENYIEISSV